MKNENLTFENNNLITMQDYIYHVEPMSSTQYHKSKCFAISIKNNPVKIIIFNLNYKINIYEYNDDEAS